jgi:hypothetical protein
VTEDDYLGRTASLLGMSLQMAVPLWAFELRARPADLLLARASGELADIVASKGDVIQFKVKGETAKAFNALAEGLAILSFCPGGVTFMGDHYEHSHPGFERFPEELVRLIASLPFYRSDAEPVRVAHAELRAALAAGDTGRLRAAAEAYRAASSAGGAP